MIHFLHTRLLKLRARAAGLPRHPGCAAKFRYVFVLNWKKAMMAVLVGAPLGAQG